VTLSDQKIDVTSYTPTDDFFGPAYVDADDVRDEPVRHRRIHGGFADTDTRFLLHLPEEGYRGRMFQPIFGAHGGMEDFFATPAGEMFGGFSVAVRLGGFMVESNQGHIGDSLDPRAGEDPTLYGYRASAEVARLAKHVAAQVYGEPPHHSYVFGGSGGGRRSPLCLENAPGVWDGALPFMGGGPIGPVGSTERIKSDGPISFSAMFNVQRVLGDKLAGVIDATQPGGDGNPFAGLSTHQAEELANLYRLGYPRGDEFMISQPGGQMWLWCSTADMLQSDDRDYFEAFWTRPGYIGHDQPELVERDLVDCRLVVDRVVTVRDVLEDPEFDVPEFAVARTSGMILAGGSDIPFGVRLADVPAGYRLGAGLRVISGKAAGRQLYAMRVIGDCWFADGFGEANILKFTDVLPGDEVHVDNHAFLAYCYYYRHHVMDSALYDFLRVDGRPIYPQHDVPVMASSMGVAYSGQYRGKLMWIHHTHDASLWPGQGVIYAEGVRRAQGDEGAAANFRLRWTENAEHGPPIALPSPPNRSNSTWLVDFLPVIEQSLADLVDWVENGVEPAGTAYEYQDGKIHLPGSASERGGIQPVVRVTVNGGPRTAAAVGEVVDLTVHAEVPPSGGSIIDVEWDFDGSGSWPSRYDDLTPTAKAVEHSTTYSYTRPGVYFPTARVTAHRDGDAQAISRRIHNVASARVVVE
jgi:Tannase and feruloyl esterase